jgi:dTDP-glucose 4,6-dehydratase
MPARISSEDLDHIASSLDDVIPHMSGKRFFITGGTGFFGKWILETLLFLNSNHNTNCSALVLTRNAEKFKKNSPQFNDGAIEYVTGDITNFPFPEGEIDYCIHAAMEGENLDKTDELEVLNAAYSGTQRVMEFAKQKKLLSTLYVSSGGVYGRQPPEVRFMPEDSANAPDTTQLRSCYGEGKRVGEFLCTYYGRKFELPVKIVRPFAFVGPYLALDAHFVIGNFIKNRLAGEPILIKGDGTPMRSYMYAADLAIYLFKVLIHGQNLTPYNLGSSEEVSILSLANVIAEMSVPKSDITVLQKNERHGLPERYVPDVTRIKTKFPAVKTISMTDAIARTLAFYSQK